MSLLDDLGRESAGAWLARALASPMTALAAPTSPDADTPAGRQVVELAPGATIPEQEPPPASPAVMRFTQGAFGKTIPVSLGRRRLQGVLIQSSTLVPRLVGNTEYEVTYEIPLDLEPEEEFDDGDELSAVKTIWCNDCNCYYCYVGPLDTAVPFDNMDKGTWPYMAMMGKYRSELCTQFMYQRIQSFDDDYHYGALIEPTDASVRWIYQPPAGTGLPGDPIVPLTCGPCAIQAPYPDAVELEKWGSGAGGQVQPTPYAYFQYGGWYGYRSEFNVADSTEIGFYYKVMQQLAFHKSKLGSFDDAHIYRVYEDPTRTDRQEWPGSESISGGPYYLPEGWYTYGDEIDFGSVWTEAEALTGMGDEETGFWEPGGQNWRDWVKDHGGWAPEDEPNRPPDYKMVEVRRIDPDDPFSEFKLLPSWNTGMSVDLDDAPTHSVASVQCTDVTDYSDM